MPAAAARRRADNSSPRSQPPAIASSDPQAAKELLADLDPERFWHVPRGTIVNVDAVSGVMREDAEKQFVLLEGRTKRLPMSRQFFHLFRQM